MIAVRQFLLYLERIDAAPAGIADKVHIPSLDHNDRKRDHDIPLERLQEILVHLDKFKYASRDHATLLLLWHTGIRLGTLQGLDLQDYTELDTNPVLHLQHRPDHGTPLKNGVDGERYINLSQQVSQVLDDYINVKRHDVEDEYGRTPLITTENGRLPKGTARRISYYWTCPEVTGIGSCSCSSSPTRHAAVKCNESVSPHVIRAASITYWLGRDVPVEAVSDRMNVTREVLDQHYDKRSAEGKAEQRRQYLHSV